MIGVLANCYTSTVWPCVATVLWLPIKLMYMFLGLVVEDVLDYGNMIGMPAVVRIHSHCSVNAGPFREVLCQ